MLLLLIIIKSKFMGQFSWITQDTGRSISSITPFQVTMTDNKGNKWTENDYQGYGEFSGKDFYSLLSEMNGGDGDRDHGIELSFSDRPHISPNLNEDPTIQWVDEKPEHCPNQGWVEYDDNGDEVTDEEYEEDEEYGGES
jgi:hypothetical protein